MENNNATFIKNSEEIFIKKYYLMFKNNSTNTNIKKSDDEINTLQIVKPNNFLRKFYTNLRSDI